MDLNEYVEAIGAQCELQTINDYERELSALRLLTIQYEMHDLAGSLLPPFHHHPFSRHCALFSLSLPFLTGPPFLSPLLFYVKITFDLKTAAIRS